MTGAASVLVAALLAQAPASFTVGISERAEQVVYRVVNDSNFDTAFLVPHFFEQRYTSRSTWITFSGRYALRRGRATTTFSLAPRVRTAGSDIDTFFQPNGDIVTAGTDGSVWLQSFAIRQDLQVFDTRGWAVDLSIGYRRSRAEFTPDDRIVTHTQPASITRTFITDRETTYSHVLDAGLSASTTRRLSARWDMNVTLGASPLTRARLVTKLPDKYPGQDVVFGTLAAGCSGGVSISRAWGQVRAGLGLNAGLTRGYQQSVNYRQQAASATLFLLIK